MLPYSLGNQKRGGLPSSEGNFCPPIQKKGGLPMVAYEDLIQVGIFIVALISLCYQIFKSRK